jgi:hypothetical protein
MDRSPHPKSEARSLKGAAGLLLALGAILFFLIVLISRNTRVAGTGSHASMHRLGTSAKVSSALRISRSSRFRSEGFPRCRF